MRLEKKEVIELVTSNIKTFEKWKGSAQTLKTRIEDFAKNREIFAGLTAEAVSDYWKDTHVKVLGNWIECFGLMITKMMNYLEDISAIDPSDRFVIENDYVDKIVEELKKSRDNFNDLDLEVKDFVRKYRKYLDHDAPSISGILSSLDESIQTADKVLRDIGALDYKYRSLNDEVEYLLYEIEKFCKGNDLLQINEDIGVLNYSLKIRPSDFLISVPDIDENNPLPTDQLIDEDGNIDFEKVQSMLQRSELSEQEINALVELICDSRVKYEDIFRFFEYSGVQLEIVENLKNNANILAERIMTEMWEQAVAIWNLEIERDEDTTDEAFNKILIKGQILRIIGLSDPLDYCFKSETTPNDYLNDQVHLYIFSSGDFEDKTDDGCFSFGEWHNKKEYKITKFGAILDNAGRSDFEKYLIEKIKKLGTPQWQEIAIKYGLKFLSLEFVGGDWTELFKILSKGNSYRKDIEGLAKDLGWLSEFDSRKISCFSMKTALAIYDLGGKVVYCEDGDDFILLDWSFDNREGMIMLAGLKTLEPPINSEGEAIQILLNDKDPRFNEVRAYIEGDVTNPGEKTYEKFRAFLAALKDKDSIKGELKEIYPDFDASKEINQQPPKILKELIKKALELDRLNRLNEQQEDRLKRLARLDEHIVTGSSTNYVK